MITPDDDLSALHRFQIGFGDETHDSAVVIDDVVSWCGDHAEGTLTGVGFVFHDCTMPSRMR